MKHILLGLITMVFALATTAQSVKIFSKKTNKMINDSMYVIYGDASRFEIKEEFKAVMDSQDSMLVAIKRVELDTLYGSEDFFCWYLCYSPEPAGTLPVWNAADSLMMYQNDTITNFSVYLKPNGTKGNAKFRYVFYPENNPTDTSFVDILFDIVTVGMEEVEEIEVSFYPNPAIDVLNVSLPTDINDNDFVMGLYDVNGRMVQSSKLAKGNNAVEIESSINSGTYFMRISKGEKLYLKEMIQIAR